MAKNYLIVCFVSILFYNTKLYIFIGNEGDANPGEIIPISLLRNRQTRRTLINHVFGYHQR